MKIYIVEVAFECDDESEAGIARCIERLRKAVETIDESDMGFEVAEEVSARMTPIELIASR